jgi:uncharacterized MAPEG superfamily protein
MAVLHNRLPRSTPQGKGKGEASGSVIVLVSQRRYRDNTRTFNQPGNTMHLHAALVTALTVLVLVLAVYLVGRARGKYGIHAPAITGNPDFERAFRAHQNTVEQVVMFLPSLWLAALYGNEQLAGYLGFAWVVGRVLYLFGYIREADKRSLGFMISALATIALLLMGLQGIIRAMMAG